MQTEIEDAIKTLILKAKNTQADDKALRLTQAALNLAHTLAIFKTSIEK